MIAVALAILSACATAVAATPVTAGSLGLGAEPASIEFRVPRNDGWVTDLAGLLSKSDEHALEARLEEWSQRTGHQIAVLTIPDLGGEPLERASIAVARAWGIGHGTRDDGALLLVAKNERKLRLEVGNGLEGALTDSISGRIIRDVITPQFRANKFSSGVRAGVEAMITVVEQGVEAVPALQRGKRHGAVAIALVVLVILLTLMVLGRFLALVNKASSTHRGRGRPRGSDWPFFAGGGGFRGGGGFGGGGGGFGGFGGGGFSGGGASGGW